MIGIHAKIKSEITGKSRGNILKSIQEDKYLLDTDFSQIFTHNPISGKKIKFFMFEKNVKLISKFDLIVHSSYILNNIMWNTNRFDNLLISELETAEQINGGLIFHVPEKLTELKKRITEISKMCNNYNVEIIFETSKNCKEMIYNFEVFDSVISQNFENFSYCVDTAHLGASGIFADIFLEKLKGNTSLFKYIHLNGLPSTFFNTGFDRHILILDENDCMFGSKYDVLYFLKHFPRSTYIVLEINRPTPIEKVIDTINLIRDGTTDKIDKVNKLIDEEMKKTE